MANEKKNSMQTRIVIVEILFFVAILLLGARSVEVQVFKADKLAGKAIKEYSTKISVSGERGKILDRNMNPLGTSVEALSVAACPSEIESPDQSARQLAKILGLSSRKLKKKLRSKKQFTWVKRRISPDQARAIKALEIKGVFFRNDSKRFYPNRGLAAQVIGFTGLEDNGLEGLEYKYNDTLKGKVQKIRIKKDGTGKLFDEEKRLRPQLSGDSIVLTIDRSIQFFSEKALKEAVTEYNAQSGMAIVMAPKTGHVLAMAHYPEFNPNAFGKYTKEIWRNRSVTDAIEPGSIMKIFTAATAVEKGYFSTKSIFFCENGTYKIGSFTIHDTHPHGWLSLRQVIKYSSNIGAVKISETVGAKTLHDTLFSFGFGRKTGIECPYETRGNLIPYKKWSKIDAGAIAFGQGISGSAIQMVTAVSAIANDGVIMKPMLVRKIISNTGEAVRIFSPTPVKRVISSATAEKIKHMMSAVVDDKGTGKKAAITGYSVCGKTGTAQKAGKSGKGYLKDKYTAVFTGFAPQADPRLAILVIVDEPVKNYYGGVVAAPAFKSIMTESLNYLSIPPDTQSKQMVASVSKPKTDRKTGEDRL
ncbi:MAG: penicillin-binding protein 2 [Desulfobacteraceae bacterium]|nr:MAG: penicillin-binding protein 2 [Desulfobacteraceae bacterium]